jgi:hypothetical protein
VKAYLDRSTNRAVKTLRVALMVTEKSSRSFLTIFFHLISD